MLPRDISINTFERWYVEEDEKEERGRTRWRRKRKENKSACRKWFRRINSKSFCCRTPKNVSMTLSRMIKFIRKERLGRFLFCSIIFYINLYSVMKICFTQLDITKLLKRRKIQNNQKKKNTNHIYLIYVSINMQKKKLLNPDTKMIFARYQEERHSVTRRKKKKTKKNVKKKMADHRWGSLRCYTSFRLPFEAL